MINIMMMDDDSVRMIVLPLKPTLNLSSLVTDRQMIGVKFKAWFRLKDEETVVYNTRYL